MEISISQIKIDLFPFSLFTFFPLSSTEVLPDLTMRNPARVF